MSVRFWLSVAGGAAGGYALGRVIEAKAAGVPLGVAFANLGAPIWTLKQAIPQPQQSGPGQPGIQVTRSLTPMLPEDATVLAEMSLEDAAND